MRTSNANGGRVSSRRAHRRTGPFWDAVEGKAPLPPAAATLGLEVIDVDPEGGTIKVAFTATRAFTTPRGDVLEGFLAAMLHDTLGPAVIATLEPGQFITTVNLDSQFLQRAYPGRLVGRGRVLRRHGDVAFAIADLRDSDGVVVATGSATIRVTRFGVLGARVRPAA